MKIKSKFKERKREGESKIKKAEEAQWKGRKARDDCYSSINAGT